MSFTVRPAVREQIGLLVGIAGASGSGKTFCALTLAKGIANGTGKIAVIDTEAGRALHYAPKPGIPIEKQTGVFEFLHLDFGPPFSPDRYVEAIKACEEAGATVIVIDSMSHEWNGEGGCSEMAEAAAIAAATDAQGIVNLKRVEAMTGPSWKKPKLKHKRMMARLIQCRTHLIFCLRAEEKVKFQKVIKKGGYESTEIVPIGFQPICEKGFIFELSGFMTLHPESIGEPRYDLPHKLNDELRAIFPEGKKIDFEAGRRLRVWAETGVDAKPVDKATEVARDLIERVQDAPNVAALLALRKDVTVAKQWEWLEVKRPELHENLERVFSEAMAVFAPDDDFPGEVTRETATA